MVGCSDWLGGGIDNVIYRDADDTDARPPDLSCLGQPIPATAPPTLTISGLIYHPGVPGVSSDEPVAGALIAGHGSDGSVESTYSVDGGSFLLTTETEGEPLDGFVEVTATGYWPTRTYSPTPLFEDLSGLEIPIINDDDLVLLAEKTEIDQLPEAALVAVEVVDCSLFPLAGVIVTTVPPAGSTVYNDIAGYPNLKATATAADGIAYLFNLPAGEVEIDAELDGVSLREHPLVAAPVADQQFTVTRVSP